MQNAEGQTVLHLTCIYGKKGWSYGNTIRLFKLSKLFTSKADHKERTTFLRAMPSWTLLLPSDVTSYHCNLYSVCDWRGGPRLLAHSTVQTKPGWGEVLGKYITPPSPLPLHIYNIRIQGYALELYFNQKIQECE